MSISSATPAGREVLARMGSLAVVRETRVERIQEFWALTYCVMVRELGARHKKLWPISHHDRSVYLLMYEGEHLLGGTRLIRPGTSGFFTYSVIAEPNTLPPESSLRQLGIVGEATHLVAAPEVRGKVDLVKCDHLIQRVAREEGMTHLILNAVIPWRTPALYRLFGYQPYADPQVDAGLRRWPEDDAPNVIPMIRATSPGQSLPPDRWGYDIGHLEQISAAYLGET